MNQTPALKLSPGSVFSPQTTGRVMAGVLLMVLPLAAEKTIYHIAVQGSTQTSCKITHKATKKEPFIKIVCEYVCERPVANVTMNAKDPLGENIYCHKDDDPATKTPSLGQPLQADDPPSSIPTLEPDEEK